MALHAAPPPSNPAPLRVHGAPGAADAGHAAGPAHAGGELDAAGELDAEVTRLLRVRGGELAEPLLWQRPSHRHEVESFVAQLAPIRSRIGLLSSWHREASRGSALRLAYAICWLRLAQRRAGEFGPHRRRTRSRVVRGPG